jgi:hypothetical protein
MDRSAKEGKSNRQIQSWVLHLMAPKAGVRIVQGFQELHAPV